ncbi:MAG: FtsW/RodA/SpoVE family cell cycle protein, partial [Rickettsiales bacterium]|nr:FtsW/RodA/SpoVE family cell cycle protein [Rickettsiales bacterium]
CLVIVLLYALVVLRGFQRIMQENDLFIVYATSGLLLMFGMQAFVNMGVALNILPNTGMTLPFISYGGSSTMAMAGIMGMVLSMTRQHYGVRKKGGRR